MEKKNMPKHIGMSTRIRIFTVIAQVPHKWKKIITRFVLFIGVSCNFSMKLLFSPKLRNQKSAQWRLADMPINLDMEKMLFSRPTCTVNILWKVDLLTKRSKSTDLNAYERVLHVCVLKKSRKFSRKHLIWYDKNST